MYSAARLLVQRWSKAKGLLEVASNTYGQLLSQVKGCVLLPTDHSVLNSMNVIIVVPVTEANVKQWIEDEKTVICATGKAISK